MTDSGSSLLKSGFTLIEMSIVLVIIGLLAGGILTGRDLIDAAAQRAQITQIERYNTAVNTFRVKYGGLPGDLPDPYASNFGFQSRGVFSGEGDGNGSLEGNNANCAGCNYAYEQSSGETVTFWRDLNQSGLIEGSFTAASETSAQGYSIRATPIYGPLTIDAFLPKGKIGQGNYINVWGSGTWNVSYWVPNSINYFCVSTITQLNNWGDLSGTGLTVQQAYNIDKKIDDGLPQSGNVIAEYVDPVNFSSTPAGYGWAGTGGAMGNPYTTATPGSFTTCFDNGGIGGIQKYSLSQNNGSGLNCALSFKFQ